MPKKPHRKTTIQNLCKSLSKIRPDAIVTDGLHAYNITIKDQFYDISAFNKRSPC